MKINLRFNYILLGIQIMIAIAAIPAGILFLIDPSGHKNGTSSAILANSPFIDFFIPGLILLLFIGIGNFSGTVLTILRKEVSGFIGIIFGIMLMVWIVLQVYWIGYSSFLQPVFFVLGLIEAAIGYILLLRVIKAR
ncbi:MAG: hypothetical protein ABSD71_13645 [Bacteroidales bacterium]|jgi:hypothetical protein